MQTSLVLTVRKLNRSMSKKKQKLANKANIKMISENRGIHFQFQIFAVILIKDVSRYRNDNLFVL